MRSATLTLLTLLGLVAGAFYGQYVLFDPLSPIDRSHWTFVAGDLLLVRPLMMLMIPLAVVGAVAAAASLRASSRFGLALGATLAWFALTMLLASVIGVAAAALLKPGEAIAPDLKAEMLDQAASRYDAAADLLARTNSLTDAGQDSLTGAWLAILRRALPDNLPADVLGNRILGVLALALLLGAGLAVIGERGGPARAVVASLLEALRTVTRWIAWIAPVGVFLLVANAVGSTGFDGVRGSIEKYMLTVAAALGVQAIVVLPFALLVLGRCNPIAYAWRVGRALATAFATSSSLAALPAAMEAAVTPSSVRRNGRKTNQPLDGRRRRSSACAPSAAGLVLPLGAMLNFNGTAIFQASAVVFLCQLHDIALSTSELVVIVITATIAAISTAGIPSGGLVTLIIVITAVNTSLAGRGLAALPVSAIGVLVAVDRALDMLRATVNVWGNLVGARIVSVFAPDDPVGFTTEITENTERAMSGG